MERFEMEFQIADKVIEGLKASRLLGAREQDVKREKHKRVEIVISLDKYASDENLKDMLGFIDFSERHKQSHGFLLGTLLHDINGMIDNEPGFSPRTTGYSTVTV